MEAISCHGLTKRFRGRPAIADLDLQVEEGEVFGLLGPNGAGKTTTIRLLLGLIHPDAGEARVLGDTVPSPQRLRDIGAIVEEPAFYPWLSGRGNLEVLLDTGPTAPHGFVQDALERMTLSEVSDRKVKTYSQGMRQRLGLAAALLRRPRLLILDEPANGLDLAGIREFRSLLRTLGDEGVTVFISSHQLGEVERICDRVAIVSKGRLVAVGGVDELGRSAERVRVEVRPEDREQAGRLLAEFGVTADSDGALFVASKSGREVNEALARGGVFAESIGPERSDLEERFLELTEGDVRAAPSS